MFLTKMGGRKLIGFISSGQSKFSKYLEPSDSLNISRRCWWVFSSVHFNISLAIICLYSNISFRDLIYIDNHFYRLQKIVDYNPINPQSTKVELLKIKNE